MTTDPSTVEQATPNSTPQLLQPLVPSCTQPRKAPAGFPRDALPDEGVALFARYSKCDRDAYVKAGRLVADTLVRAGNGVQFVSGVLDSDEHPSMSLPPHVLYVYVGSEHLQGKPEDKTNVLAICAWVTSYKGECDWQTTQLPTSTPR